MYLRVRLNRFFDRIDDYGWPFILLAIRLSMGHLFWTAGIIKIKRIDSTLALFRFEYKVPLIPPEIAAYLTMGFELICPIMLVLGFMTRIATIPLLGIISVIQIFNHNNHDHLFWSLLLLVLLFRGPGSLTVEELWRRYQLRY